jgi:phosphoglycolate phosphatase
MQIAAVLIDLDGTLLDTAPDLAEAANRMRGDFGMAPLPQNRIAQFVGKGAEVLVHRTLTDDLHGRLDAATYAKGHASFFRHYHAVNGTMAVVYDGVLQALALLREHGLRLACVTNKPREFTLPLLERMGLTAQLDAIVGGDEVPHRKPHPALLYEACARLGVPVARAWMIGDSENDLLAAHAAGCSAILVEGGYNEGVPLSALARHPGLDVIVDSLLKAAERVLAARRAAG